MYMLSLFHIYHHHHHHRVCDMELDHLLTRSALTYPEVSSKVCHDSFCPSGSSVSLPWVINYKGVLFTWCIHFLLYPSNLSKLVLFLTPLQFVYLFRNLSMHNNHCHRMTVHLQLNILLLLLLLSSSSSSSSSSSPSPSLENDTKK